MTPRPITSPCRQRHPAALPTTGHQDTGRLTPERAAALADGPLPRPHDH